MGRMVRSSAAVAVCRRDGHRIAVAKMVSRGGAASLRPANGRSVLARLMRRRSVSG
jgi:hypothetical protein